MKKSILLLLLALTVLSGNSQSFTASNIQQPTCFGACNGSVTFTTNSANGPYTAVFSNSASCPNSTVSSSGASSITVTGICACASDYTVSIYSGTIIAGVNYVQFPNYATAPLTVSVPTLVAASCATCCTGKAYVTWSGGNTSFTNSPPSFILDGSPTTSYSPTQNLCAGSHTICVKDSSQCVACKVFTITTNITTGITQLQEANTFNLFPNPVLEVLTIEMNENNIVERTVVTDFSGRIVLISDGEGSISQQTNINVQGLEAGMYYIEVYTAENTSPLRKRFVKKPL